MTGLATYSDAMEWLQAHWTPREIPLRLHTIASEGWGPFFTTGFQRILDAKPHDLEMGTDSRICNHLRLQGGNQWECPDCLGVGVYDVTTPRYRYPMWRAMVRLAAFDRAHPPMQGLPGMAAVVYALVLWKFDSREIGQPLVLRAIRRLFDCYEQGPVSVGWTQKSQAQQNAEVAA